MLIDHRHDRMANAILYFAARTHQCTKTKLMHLLYLLDFEHFAATGRNVTGSTYCALASGPAPAALYWEFERPVGTPSFLDDLVQAQDVSAAESILLPKSGAVDDDLTRRQIALLSEISAEFCSDRGVKLTERVCAVGQPWCLVYQGGRGKLAAIPYEMALEGLPNKEQILESAREHREFRQAFTNR